MISNFQASARKPAVLKPSVTVFLVISLVACKSYDPQRVEEDFGKSVRQMIEEQTVTPATTPPTAGPDRLDGETAVETVENYLATGKKKRLSGSTTPGAPQ